MNVLSLFDGMSCGRIALDRAGVAVTNYYASEIDKYSILVSKHNYPSIIQIGDVLKVSYKDGILHTENGDFNVGKIDLLIGGSPCQSISNLGDKKGLDGKSGLFWEYARLLKETQAAYFILENVKGSKKALAAIDLELNTKSVEFNSNLVSAQNRKRLYWSNIPYVLPTSKDIKLVEILDEYREIHDISASRFRWLLSEKGLATVNKKYAAIDPEKANCLTARSDASWNCNYVTRQGKITKLSPEEYEKLQTVPVGYTSIVKTSERYRMLGNGWTVDVIAHILKGICK